MVTLRSLLVLTPALLAAALHAQSAGGRTPVAPGTGTRPGGFPPRELVPKPGGGSFVVDPNQFGRAHDLGLAEVRWGRLVDVHALDANGLLDPAPVLRDFVVGETVQSDGSGYALLTSPSTHVERLCILRQPGAPEPFPGAGTFTELLFAAEDASVFVPPKDLDAALVATLPRNAALSLRFDDLLADAPSAALSLIDDVRVFVAPSPSAPPGTPFTPFAARVLFDGSHGALTSGAFHSTRVVLDLTISSLEAGEFPVPLDTNPLGLPPAVTSAASFVLRLPTQTDPGSGQFTLLRNLAGKALSASGNGPVDLTSPTVDLVRAARAAREDEPSGGYLLDLEPPQVLGALPLQVTQAVADPNGTAGFSFLVDWNFTGPCAGRPLVLDGLRVGSSRLEVLANGPAPSAGAVHGVRVRLTQHTPVAASALLGNGVLETPLRPGTEASACWFTILPTPAQPPATGVSVSSQFVARFSEPMRATSVDPYDGFRLVQGPLSTPADATNTVVAQQVIDPDASTFALSPVLPLAHVQGQATVYHLEILAGSGGPTDLAGNPLVRAPAAELRIAPSEATQASAGLVLTFDASDEMPGVGPDLRGQFFFDFTAGEIRGRPPAFFGAPVDRTNPVPSIMIPFPLGVFTPLNPLGSKLQSVWRYCDMGFAVRDETKYNVDVVGLSWAPRGGLVVNDFYPQFEISLGHSKRLPDEAIDNNLLPRWPNSGLPGGPSPFDGNYLSGRTVTHGRDLGYSVSGADLYMSSTGTALMPYPLNRGAAPLSTYTWRDTSVLEKAGPNGVGIPLDIEVGAPLFLEPQVGAVAATDQVPTIGLPLLMEYRCYPSDTAIGLNTLDVSLAVNSSALPAFRAYSSGGFNTAGLPVVVLPDSEPAPRGGYNPSSNPPGQRTAFSADNVFYIGQLDLVYRVSRVHSAWFDTGASGTDYVALLPTVVANENPGHVPVLLAVRGATGFAGTGGAENDARQQDAYGELRTGSVSFLNGDASWKSTLNSIDGARFVQFRITLVNDLEPLFYPALDALALAYQH